MKEAEERIYEKFIKRYEQRAVQYLSNHFPVLSGEHIKDIVQDSYVTLINNIKANKVTEPQYPYFLRICINLSLKAVGKKSKHMEVGIDDTEIQQKDRVSMNKVESILQVCDEEQAVIQEKKRLVRKALEEMATKCRELLWSFYADELSWATIAGQYGLKNANTAKSQASRCRQTFKEKYNHLKANYYGEN